jgi:Cu-Zn family superoxide dismutase
LRDGAGNLVGQATFFEDRSGVRLRVEVRGLTPGQHGIHLHAVGRCEGPDFTSAGGHFNPSDRQHGLQNPAGPHGGDLPDLVAVADGVTLYETTTARVTLQAGRPNSLFDADGSALVIHADADDQVSDPAGNSGGRVVCGVIRR